MVLKTDLKEGNIVKFFILIPVYNVEKYIDACLQSVLHQTYQNFSVIIVDDGTPDNAGKICDSYASQDNRITVIHKDNGGLISARQTAIKYMLSLSEQANEYVIFLDSDDTLRKDALEILSESIRNSNADMVIYGMNRVDDSMKIVEQINSNIEEIIIDKNKLYMKVFCDYSYNPLCRKAILKKLFYILDYSKYYSVSHGEDLLQSIYYYKKSKKVLFINQCLYNYRINPQSITHSVDHKTFTVNFLVREKVMEFLLDEKVFSESDYEIYRGYCIKLIVDMIIRICRFDISSSAKVAFLEKIAQSGYYQKYLKNKKADYDNIGKRKIIYIFFENYRYRMIVCILTLIDKLRRLGLHER